MMMGWTIWLNTAFLRGIYMGFAEFSSSFGLRINEMVVFHGGWVS